MECVNLGRTGLKVSKISLGCLGFGSPAWMPWILDETSSRPILTRALDAGIIRYLGASKRDVEIALERHRETVVDFARLQTAA